VLGQAQTLRRRTLPLAAIALGVLLIAPAVSGADPSHSVSSLRARDAAIEAKSRSAVLDLYSLDSRLERSRTQVSTLQGQARSLRAQRSALEAQLKVAQHSTKIGERRLEERVRRLYEEGSVEPIEVVFGAKSLDQAISNLDNLRSISSESEAVLHQLKSARRALTTASRALAAREAALAAATRQAQAAEAALASTRTQRASYIASLAAQHRLTQGQIATLMARAQAAQVRSAELMRVRSTSVPVSALSPTPAPSASTAVAPSGRSLTVSATAYSLPGHTASGLPVGWGVVAVDPSVIPLGTHMYVPGYGEAVAADTGTAIIGDRIDLWFPTLAQAQAWGRQTVTIVLH
jgi:peptidoglycan DL-endopeptidase CwlO